MSLYEADNVYLGKCVRKIRERHINICRHYSIKTPVNAATCLFALYFIQGVFGSFENKS